MGAIQMETLALIGLALGAGAMVKGATGMGLPIIAMPMLATAFGVPHAIAVLTVPLIVTNAWQVWQHRSHARGASFLKRLLAAGIFGIGIGTWLLTAVPERSLSLVLGLLVVAYVGLQVLHTDFRLSGDAGRGLAPVAGAAAGMLQGATGISSPIGVTFIHALRLEREAHIFAVSAMFLLFSLTQLPALAVAGIMSWPRFVEGLIALVPVLALMPLGAWVGRALSRRTFDVIILGLLVILAVELIWKSINASGQG
ncbi:sulfite exporter TauE/SafE family protein [Arenibaculum sp.]|uniref:sulfite exporter TauE/SafE family protein n=1 Tax=Arenibaculum sp. TaxID=2865862 RepID=UPI002E14BD24|nr:sulfite exporter TauE/SafE family protein [Arenibaculum sp.]